MAVDELSKHDGKIVAYFTNMYRDNSVTKYEYLMHVHDMKNDGRKDEKNIDEAMNLSDFLPEPRSLNQVIKLAGSIRDKWGTAINKEITGLFDNDTFGVDENPLPNDEVIPTKLALKAKLNSYGGLDKLKARVCFRGDMQEKNQKNLWSPTASVRLLNCNVCVFFFYGKNLTFFFSNQKYGKIITFFGLVSNFLLLFF